MADHDNGAAPQTTDATNGGATAPQVRMQVLTQFVRDLSFENVLAQRGAGGEVHPDVQVSVSLDGKKRAAEHQFEVVCKINITSRNKDSEEMLFLLEMEYVGVFRIEGVPDDQLHPYLLIECPRQIFPFMRRIVNDVTRDGGFPPLNLESIDFVELYRQEIVRRQAAQSQPADA